MTKEQSLLTTEYLASLLLSLQSGRNPEPLPEGITFADVYKMARNHSLAAAAHTALFSTSSDVKIPDALRASWAREVELAAIQHTRQVAAFAELTASLTAEKIPFLPVKGFILKKLWSHPELRVMSDVDIVVSADDLERAREVLTSLGYTVTHTDEVHSSYVKRTVSIELHHTLYDGATESFADWTPRAVNPFWHEMSEEDFLIFFLRHAKKHYENGGCGLRTLFDLHLILSKYGRPDSHSRLADKLRAADLFEFYNTMSALTDRLFCGISNSDTDEALLYIAAGGTYGSFDNKVSHSINKKGSRTRHVLSRIFPSYKAMAERYAWVAKCPPLLPVAYVLRLISALFDGSARREMRSVNKTKTK